MPYIFIGLVFLIVIQAVINHYNQREELKYRNMLIRREQLLYTRAAMRMQMGGRDIKQAEIDREVNKLRSKMEAETLINMAFNK